MSPKHTEVPQIERLFNLDDRTIEAFDNRAQSESVLPYGESPGNEHDQPVTSEQEQEIDRLMDQGFTSHQATFKVLGRTSIEGEPQSRNSRRDTVKVSSRRGQKRSRVGKGRSYDKSRTWEEQ